MSYGAWMASVECMTPEKWMRPELEAFGLAALLNYDNQLNGKIDGKLNAKPRFTVNGSAAKKNQGWNEHGMTVYNDMMRAVKKRRVKDRENNNEMANLYRRKKRDEFKKRKKKGTKKKEVRRNKRKKKYPTIENET